MASELNQLTLGSRTLVAVVFPKPIIAFRLIQNYLRVFFQGFSGKPERRKYAC